jgi:UDP:flavonoid glycosyltransferase YjiC (YdhE family)
LLLTLLTSGTLGDVLPYLALGRGLQAAGMAVRLVAPNAFRLLVEAQGLPFAPLTHNPTDLLFQHSAALRWQSDPLRTLRATRAYLRDFARLQRQLLDETLAACRGAQGIVFGLASLWGATIADVLGISAIWGVLQPIARTRHFPSALWPVRPTFGAVYNRLTYAVLEWALWQTWQGAIRAWAQGKLAEPHTPRSFFAQLNAPPTVVLNAYSPTLVPRPADWPEKQVITGFWALPAEAWSPPKALTRFLTEARDPLVSIGFGSVGVAKVGRVAQIVEKALEQGQLCAVAVGFWPPARSSPRVFPIAAIPHHWLFPRVRVTAHVAGAGATAMSLRAARPIVALPGSSDQFFWAERIAALGLGPHAIPQSTLTAEKLATALRAAVDDPCYHQQAADVGARARHETGVANAVKCLQMFA